MDWYYAQGQQQVGPLPDAELVRLAGAGAITDQTLVWHAGMPEWRPYGEVKPAAAPPPVAPVVEDAAARVLVCSECQRSFPREEMISFGNAWVCAACKPVFVQKLKEGVALPGTREYGGFWIRFAAKFVDGLLLGGVNLLVGVAIGLVIGLLLRRHGGSAGFLAMGLGFLVQFCIGIAYTTWFLGTYGATPGKMACGLKVIRTDGSKLTYGRAFGRHFADMLSGLTLCIGYIIAGFDDEKRALHDRICDTRVVKK